MSDDIKKVKALLAEFMLVRYLCFALRARHYCNAPGRREEIKRARHHIETY